MRTTTPDHSAGLSTRSDSCPFAERFGRRLPRGFADEAETLDWRELLDTYAPSTDHFHLADFSRRPLGRGITAYEAILATRDPSAPGEFTAHRLTTESCGDLTAMSEMLGRIGARVEIERFHQYEGEAFDGSESWCTILRATCGRRATWAMGFGRSPSEASIAALLSAATLLHLR
ncbi:hypothetical protein CEY15_04155 [Dietzia natronolimnaea]|uniref:2-isopropylmalate synthase n=1 Tax=Dietzia natronolimnaea TaxID=161920 RepID=A0A2A2WT84_9ACTN|nr:hypothetical protein [Dietzia natronolimnaea]PAY24194.1 hypothetical protein CEY15_04155 [Dietzia natronolimnaea]